MRAYSLDLRKKIVEAVKRGVPKAEAARTFGVGISSVKRYVKMVEESCSLAPKKAPGKRKKLDERGMRLLREPRISPCGQTQGEGRVPLLGAGSEGE
jgi:transposase